MLSRSLLVLFAAMLALSGRGQAMPVFAQAYGIQCSVCHTAVPALNAYGRYIQRTGFAALDRNVLKTTPPIWFGESLNGDSTGGVSAISDNYKNSFGNLALHAGGYVAPDWTYHIHQWLVQNDDVSSVDTAWVSYNNLFNRNGHLFVGKYEVPAPSPFSQWSDLSSFAAPAITVGEHPYQLDANRCGAKLAYVTKTFDAEAGWLGPPNGIASQDFAPTEGRDDTFAWKVASARGDQPLEIGAFGSVGSFIVSTGDVDRYNAIAAYVQRDPMPHGVPGILGIYQIAHDSNPGLDEEDNQIGATRSRAFTAEIFEPVFNNNAVLAYRNEYTDDGLGNIAHYGTVDFAFNVPGTQYLRGYLEAGLGANSTTPNGTPTWRWMLWWTVPIRK